MIVKWEPYWYELDQCIVVGDIDLFYLRKDNLYFANGLNSELYEREGQGGNMEDYPSGIRGYKRYYNDRA